ncbi:AlpA family phage regulatory protein [Photobacterium leiognathi]
MSKSISLGERAVGWLESEIESWISNKSTRKEKRIRQLIFKLCDYLLL